MTLTLEESICFYMISFYSDPLSDIVSVLSVLMSEPPPLTSSPLSSSPLPSSPLTSSPLLFLFRWAMSLHTHI